MVPADTLTAHGSCGQRRARIIAKLIAVDDRASVPSRRLFSGGTDAHRCDEKCEVCQQPLRTEDRALFSAESTESP